MAAVGCIQVGSASADACLPSRSWFKRQEAKTPRPGGEVEGVAKTLERPLFHSFFLGGPTLASWRLGVQSNRPRTRPLKRTLPRRTLRLLGDCAREPIPREIPDQHFVLGLFTEADPRRGVGVGGIVGAVVVVGGDAQRRAGGDV